MKMGAFIPAFRLGPGKLLVLKINDLTRSDPEERDEF
jgi:hypothetical protein